MGTITSFGPCMIHGGMGVSVGVNVDVGISVGVGETVAVSVAMGVCEAMLINVGEGSGLAVRVGSMTLVGEGCLINVNPPHPINNSPARDIQIKKFFKLFMAPPRTAA